MNDDCEKTLGKMMLQFCSAKRYAYNRIVENMNKKDFKLHHLDGVVQDKYNLNSRQAKDAIEIARQTKQSQIELIDTYISDLQDKIKPISKKLEDKDLPDKKRQALVSKLEKRTRKLNKYLEHKKNNTLPSIIFGGKENFYKRCAGKISNEEFKKNRNNQFVSRGDKTKDGNPNLRVIEDEKGLFFLEITTLEKIYKDGKDTGRYVKIKTPLYIPEKRSKKTGRVNGFHYKVALIRFLNLGEAYQVELLKRNGKIYAHITFDLEKPRLEATGHNYLIGIDTNPDGLSLTMIDRNGQYVWHTYLKDHRLLHVNGNLRDNICGELACTAVRVAKVYGAGISIEDLDFKDNVDVKGKFKRVKSQFCYSKLITSLESACYKYGVELTKVRPHFTSKIGLYKYCHQYGMYVHNGAAMVIARRAYGYIEKVPKTFKKLFEPIHIIEKDKLITEKIEIYDEFSIWKHVSKRMHSVLRKNNHPRFFLENRKNITKGFIFS